MYRKRLSVIIFRVDPPTPEELSKNLAIMQMKKINAAKLDEHYAGGKTKAPQEITGGRNYPEYNEYELSAGKKKDEWRCMHAIGKCLKMRLVCIL